MNITVITGPMKSGKSKKIIDIINSSNNYLAFKPKLDSRDLNYIKSRNGNKVDSIFINNFKDIYEYLNKDLNCIFIDEVQFLNDVENIKTLITILYSLNIDLIVSGLDLDSDFNPFKTTSILMTYATNIIKLSSICENCNSNNSYISKCIINKNNQILTGDNIYKAYCLDCYLRRTHE